MKRVVFALLILGLLAALALPAGAAEPVWKKNVIVAKEDGRFGGWPANNGAWSWGNEILVGFSWGYFKPNGKTWGEEIILRDDAGCWDLGYPRTVQRPDGKIVTVYYFNDHQDQERYITATIWDPGKGKGLGFQK